MAPELITVHPSEAKFIPIESLISLSDKGLSNNQIAKQLGCTPSNITQRFNRFGYTTDRVKQFNSAKPSILSLIQSKLLNSINDEEIQKAPLQTKVWCYGVLHDKQADLERKALVSTPDDTGLEDLSVQLSRIAARSPIVVNNILNIVGSLPPEVRDRLGNSLPQSLVANDNRSIIEGECNIR